MAAGDADGAAQQAEAFRRLYPDQYLARFLASGIRADGRPLARARPTTVGVNAVGTADSSALVKVGNTTAMAGIKLEVGAPGSSTLAPHSPLGALSRLSVLVYLKTRARNKEGMAYRHPGRLPKVALKLQVMVPAEDKPNEGEVAVLVELAPLCSAETRPGRASEAAQCLTEQVSESAVCVRLCAPASGFATGL